MGWAQAVIAAATHIGKTAFFINGLTCVFDSGKELARKRLWCAWALGVTGGLLCRWRRAMQSCKRGSERC
ncbi:MAG: hypothetical protein R3E99_17570, partial [Burkholderiaceae bacterium]